MDKKEVKQEIKKKMQEANKVERKTPLFISDPRFKTFLKTTSRHFRQKYAKLFRRTRDKNERNAADEMVVTLAAFVFEELRMLHRVKEQTGIDAFIAFNQYFFAMMDTWLPKEGQDGVAVRTDGVRKKNGAAAQTEGQSTGEDVADGGSSESTDVPGEATNGRERTFGGGSEDAGGGAGEDEGNAETTNTEEAS